MLPTTRRLPDATGGAARALRVLLVVVLAQAVALAAPFAPGPVSVPDAAAPQIASAAGVSWYGETQHSLSGPIREWWEAHGGVAIYGFPLSEPFAWQAETGETVVAQYFERARLEYHPSLHGTAQQVQVGRLGVEVTSARVEEAAFAAVPADALMVWSDCTFYAETGHRICAPFTAWWEAHGGVETFGYPLSEQLLENGLLVQYFERARLEQQAGLAGTEWEIEVGHLGHLDAEERGLLDTTPFQALAESPIGAPLISEAAVYADPYGGETRRLAAGTTVRILDGPRNDRLLVQASLLPETPPEATATEPADDGTSEDPFAADATGTGTGTADAEGEGTPTAEQTPATTETATATATPPEPEIVLGWVDAGSLLWQTNGDPREATIAPLATWNSDASALLRDSRGYVSVAFYDPATNTIWHDGDAGPVEAASLAKSLLVTVAIQQREAAGEDIGDLLGAFSLAITLSDNEISDYLWSVIGGQEGVRAFLEANRLVGFDVPSLYDWGDISADATAWATFFATLGSGRLLQPEHTAMVLELFHDVIGAHRWGVLSPANDRLSIGKNGWYTDSDPFMQRVNGAAFLEQRDGPPGLMPMVGVVMTHYPADAGEGWGHDAAEALVQAALACSGQRWASVWLEAEVPCAALEGVPSALERAESLWR